MKSDFVLLLFLLLVLIPWLEHPQNVEALLTVCSLPPAKGPCPNRLTRYYYNHNRKQCESFVYGGCLGNGNKFQTRDSCEKMCEVSKEKLPMPVPPTRPAPSTPERPMPGPPTTTMPRTPRPSPSPGSGQDQSVARLTVCSLPPAKGPCPNRLTRYYYNHNRKQCESFIYGGCLGNGNKFPTPGNCEKRCKVSKASPTLCSLPPSKGPCPNRLTRYYYNQNHKQCEPFIYGGCEGNGNAFETLESCEKWCKVSKEVLPTPTTRPDEETTTAPSMKDVSPAGRVILPSICKLPPEQGRCQANHTRYYYNMEKHACAKFIYTGCLGNANRFLTAAKCSQRCKMITGIPTICTVPKNSGPCSEKLSRYYYNQKSKNCEQFIYGGCGGNANNFQSSQECKKICLV
nr:actinia tenebrosa protease inhibitors-like [Anolis sagrei ordinatus]